MNAGSTIDQINNIIQWFDDNNNNMNIGAVSATLDKFNILLTTFNEDVCAAYETWQELEDTYKQEFAKKISDKIRQGDTKAKAEVDVVVELEKEKKEWTKAENLYRRLRSYLDRFDKIADSKRQRISVQKAFDLKNI